MSCSTAMLQRVRGLFKDTNAEDVTLIAVSKFQPISCIVEAFEVCNLHDFGENYVQDLSEKSKALPSNVAAHIRWHFIGELQSNKIKHLLKVKNLWSIHSVASLKTARILNASWGELRGTLMPQRTHDKMKIFIQVSTSSKKGRPGLTSYPALVELAKFVTQDCEFLELLGLMCVAAHPDDPANRQTPREQFDLVRIWARKLEEALNIHPGSLKLSMGMTADYKEAILAGSNFIRIGSAIFGSRSINNPNV